MAPKASVRKLVKAQTEQEQVLNRPMVSRQLFPACAGQQLVETCQRRLNSSGVEEGGSC